MVDAPRIWDLVAARHIDTVFWTETRSCRWDPDLGSQNVSPLHLTMFSLELIDPRALTGSDTLRATLLRSKLQRPFQLRPLLANPHGQSSRSRRQQIGAVGRPGRRSQYKFRHQVRGGGEPIRSNIVTRRNVAVGRCVIRRRPGRSTSSELRQSAPWRGYAGSRNRPWVCEVGDPFCRSYNGNTCRAARSGAGRGRAALLALPQRK